MPKGYERHRRQRLPGGKPLRVPQYPSLQDFRIRGGFDPEFEGHYNMDTHSFLRQFHVVILGIATVTACAEPLRSSIKVQLPPDIHETKAAHTEALIAIPGVVGVAVGKSGDRPCIRVYLERDTPALRKLVPSELNGHPVEIVVTGPFKAGG
jgi:hypothetical protein